MDPKDTTKIRSLFRAIGECALLLAAIAWANAALGQAIGNIGGAYPNGTSGLMAGTVPPPGQYWLMYNRFYHAPISTDDGGEPATAPAGGPLGFGLDTYVNAHRIVTVTDKKIWGATYAWNFVVPLVGIDVNIDAFDVHDQNFTIADINVEPFVIEWHQERFDFGFVFGLFAPTASYAPERPALPGRDYWTLYPGVAGTYYLDDEKTWNLSFLSRYEIHTEREGTDFRRGDDLSFEWGLGKSLDAATLLGVSGYCSWQTTDNTGTGSFPRDRGYGVGPEIQYFSTQYKCGFHLRHWFEFANQNRTEGTITTLTFVKPF
jgi:hypothetical protein